MPFYWNVSTETMVWIIYYNHHYKWDVITLSCPSCDISWRSFWTHAGTYHISTVVTSLHWQWDGCYTQWYWSWYQFLQWDIQFHYKNSWSQTTNSNASLPLCEKPFATKTSSEVRYIYLKFYQFFPNNAMLISLDTLVNMWLQLYKHSMWTI